jgi:ribonuclease HII
MKDREMHMLAEKYPEYGFDTNKGYGTKQHQEALLKHGLTPVHRIQYCKKYI